MDQPDQASPKQHPGTGECAPTWAGQKPALCIWDSPQHDDWAPAHQKGLRDVVEVSRLSL